MSSEAVEVVEDALFLPFFLAAIEGVVAKNLVEQVACVARRLLSQLCWGKPGALKLKLCFEDGPATP